MNTDISVHSVSTVTLGTATSGNTQWLAISAYDDNGNQLLDLTLYANAGKAITLKLGEAE